MKYVHCTIAVSKNDGFIPNFWNALDWFNSIVYINLQFPLSFSFETEKRFSFLEN